MVRMSETTAYDHAGCSKRPDFSPHPTLARRDAPCPKQGRRRVEPGGGTDRTSWGRSPYNGSWRTEKHLQHFRLPRISIGTL